MLLHAFLECNSNPCKNYAWHLNGNMGDQASALTDFTMEGRPHSVLSNLWLCNFPEGSTCLSSTSTPTTLGFMGFGYFCIAAVVTVSQGWLQTNQKLSV